ncbi:MAG: hypothetical protein KDB88_02645 [Flavobacteriales bacterium]|nr:hypothetical protein [Flavobacteriales bacterium]
MQDRPLLDDNTRSALHFMLGAVLLLVLIRLVVGAVAWTMGPVDASETIWRHGYVLQQPGTLVVANWTLNERLSWGLLVGIASGSLAALLAWSLARAANRTPNGFHLTIGRWIGYLVLGYASLAAVAIPERSATPLGADARWELMARSSALRIPLIGTGRLHRIAFAAVDDYGADLRTRPGASCDRFVRVWLVAHRDTAVLCSASPTGPDCDRNGTVLLEQARSLVGALEADLSGNTGL